MNVPIIKKRSLQDQVNFEIFHKEVSYETHLKSLSGIHWQRGRGNHTEAEPTEYQYDYTEGRGEG